MDPKSKSEINSFFNDMDELMIMKEVISTTHLPDGTNVDVTPILQLTQHILGHIDSDHSSPISTAHKNVVKVDELAIPNSLRHIIEKLAIEMEHKCKEGWDKYRTMIELFHTVRNYHWDAKLVLTLAAFARNYGKFWILTTSKNTLAKTMAILKHAQNANKNAIQLKGRYELQKKLIHSILELTRCIVEFSDLPSNYITADMSPVKSATDKIPIGVHWNVNGIIHIITQIAKFTSNDYEELHLSWQLTLSTKKINLIHQSLSENLENCLRLIREKKEFELQMLFKQLLETIQIDNMRILKTLISPNSYAPPLFNGATKETVSLEVLRSKTVLLVISGLDMSQEELLTLEEIYNETNRIQRRRKMDALYEVVWMPIVDPTTDAMDKKFEEMRDKMPWYSVSHPSLIDKAIAGPIRDRWRFVNTPVIVALDPHGKELSTNAIYMMWIWRVNAFPFTGIREELLWSNETWRLELLVGQIDPTILNWIRDDKYIFLFGGDDIEWIRKFTNASRAMAKVAGIPLEMAYVGKSKKKKSVQQAISIINTEKLSYCLQESTKMWFFWTRLESMLYSKMHLKKADDQHPVMQEIKKLLSYDKDGSWALLCKGSNILTHGYGKTMMQTTVDFDLWKGDIPSKGFDLSFIDYHDKLHVAAKNCYRFEFRVAACRVPENMRCPECHRIMEKYIAFLCCHDHDNGLLESY